MNVPSACSLGVVVEERIALIARSTCSVGISSISSQENSGFWTTMILQRFSKPRELICFLFISNSGDTITEEGADN